MRPIRPSAVLALTLLLTGVATARQDEAPWSLLEPSKLGVDLAIVEAGRIDAGALLKAETLRQREPGMQDKRLRVAAGIPLAIEPAREGRWDRLDDGTQVWRVRLRVAGATDLRVGFSRFALPPGAKLHVIGADDYYQGPYVAADALHGSFESPLVPGDQIIVELQLPSGARLADDALRIDWIGAGFRDLFGRTKIGQPGSSGACNINVICSLGQPYLDQARAVAYIEFRNDDDGAYYMCTGTLLADVPRSGKNWFLTAAHCINSASEANSITAYWNYQSTQCGSNKAPAGGYFNDDQHGGSLRAHRADVDFSLLELSGTRRASWNLYPAGWDATGATPSGTIGVHHPSGDVTKVTAATRAPSSMSSCIDTGGPANTHWWTGPYSQGTTEGGSSGSGLFIPSADGSSGKRLIGILSGGDAYCSSSSPTQPNAGGDCYGKFAVAWNGSAASSRLRDWLDPGNTGTRSIAGGDQDPGSEQRVLWTPLEPPPILRQQRHRRAARP